MALVKSKEMGTTRAVISVGVDPVSAVGDAPDHIDRPRCAVESSGTPITTTREGILAMVGEA